MKYKALRKDFIWNFIGLTLYSFSSLFYLIIITRVNGLKTAGIFSYSFSLCCLFYYISLYFNRTSQISNSKYTFSDYLSSRVIYCILSFILIILFSFISSFSLNKTLIIILLMILKTFEAISECFYGFIHKKNRLYEVGISFSIKSAVGLIIFAICDYLIKSVEISLILTILVNMLVLIFYDIRKYKEVKDEKIHLSLCKFKKITFEFLPIFLFSFIANFLCSVQKLILTYHVSDEVQTIFGIIIMPATILSLIGGYLINPFLNRFVTFRDNSDYKSFNKLLSKILITLVFLGIIVLLVTYIMGIPVLNMIYNVEISSMKRELLLIILASIFLAISSIYSSCLTILDKNNIQLYIYVITSITSIIISTYAIRKYGINGAVYAYLITFIIHFIIYTIVYIKNINIKKEIRHEQKN